MPSTEQIALGVVGTLLSGLLSFMGVDMFRRLREAEQANAKAVSSRAVMHTNIEHMQEWQDKFELKFDAREVEHNDTLKLVLDRLDKLQGE
jgi:hypothetical protein